MDRKYVLVINPGSTSTKVAVFHGESQVKSHQIEHKKDELDKYNRIVEQYEYRLELIQAWLKEEGIRGKELRAVVGRGGMLRPIPGGTYKVSDEMLRDLRNAVTGEHASNLGAILAKSIGDKEAIASYIVDPVSVDEFEDISRISGLNLIERKSQLHALNIKSVAYRRAKELERDLEDLSFIVAHLGGGISIASIDKGRMIDVSTSNEMGPFSPERSGGLPVGDLVERSYSGEYSLEESKKIIRGQGGLVSYLGTADAREIEGRIEAGDKYAKLIYDAMIYQIGKSIGGAATVLKGRANNIIITGGLAYSDYLVGQIKNMLAFISPIVVYPGEGEMFALNQGVLRVMSKRANPKIYEDEVTN